MITRTTSGLTVGYDEAGTGRPLVLLHAFPFDRAMWRPQRDGLRDVARVITPDLRGFGETGGFLGEPSVERLADDAAEFLDALGVTEPVVLGGLSMGGYAALAFARRHPQRLRALVLADTKAEPDDEAAKANRDKLIAFASGHPAAAVIEQLLPKLVSEETRAQRPAVVEEVQRIASAQAPAAVVAALRMLRDRPDAGPSLAAIAVPALVIVGSEDALTPPAVAQSLAERIAGARLETIPGAGHVSNLERPDAFNDAVRRFLQALSGA
jgi:pimeloyl-ACP methyl ester carboxylesterase